MTGRDLIIYILANGLENEPVFKDGKIIGLMTVEEMAVQFDVSISTVLTWYALDMIDGVIIGDRLFIFRNTKHPLKK